VITPVRKRGAPPGIRTPDPLIKSKTGDVPDDDDA